VSHLPLSSFPIVIVGAGAAGLVAAIFAAERAPVLVLERTRDGGRKILISGGGRCNILPVTLEPHRFVTESPAHLLRGLLRSWPLAQQRAFFECEVGLPIVLEERTGKLFPRSGRARDVRDALVALAMSRGVQFAFDTSLDDVQPVDGAWRLATNRGPMDARAVVLATGGLSVPQTGSDGTGLDVARRLGHTCHETYPALTPIVCDPAPFGELAGVSLSARLRATSDGRTHEAEGGFLFTHRGYSGPAVLDLSHLVVRSRMRSDPQERAAALRASWSEHGPEFWTAELSSSPALVMTVLARTLPTRLAQRLVELSGVPPGRRANALRRTERHALVEALTACVLPWTGDEGYKKAEVTGGGIALDEVDRRTLESRRHPGLFLCGEMLDAFGPIGGHNFAWAWATGRAAGLGVAST
jgi:predicted Rossmann fold flavoprotein